VHGEDVGGFRSSHCSSTEWEGEEGSEYIVYSTTNKWLSVASAMLCHHLQQRQESTPGSSPVASRLSASCPHTCNATCNATCTPPAPVPTPAPPLLLLHLPGHQ
jgi:hypothetical protein